MKARLIASHHLSPDVKHFVFEVPDVEQLPYQVGQFVSFTHELNGKHFTRAYSTCSQPQGNRFELCLNEVKEGRFSPHLFRMTPGDTVEMKGPLGTFGWKQPVRDSVLVATGTGIAPFRGMLQERLPRDHEHTFTLIFGARYEPNLLYREEFEEFARQYPHFRFLPTLTRPSERWQGLTGRVQPHVLDVIGERRDLDIYLCGMKEMIDDLRSQLKAFGFDRKQIVAEKYD